MKIEDLGEVTDVVFHHSMSAPATTKRETIERWHREKGWSRIGYHYVIESDPVVIRRCPPVAELGIHVANGNHGRIGVCVVGDNRFPEKRWSPTQVHAAVWLLSLLRRVYPGIGFGGHRDYDPDRTCPEIDVRWLFEVAGHPVDLPRQNFGLED